MTDDLKKYCRHSGSNQALRNGYEITVFGVYVYKTINTPFGTQRTRYCELYIPITELYRAGILIDGLPENVDDNIEYVFQLRSNGILVETDDDWTSKMVSLGVIKDLDDRDLTKTSYNFYINMYLDYDEPAVERKNGHLCHFVFDNNRIRNYAHVSFRK